MKLQYNVCEYILHRDHLWIKMKLYMSKALENVVEPWRIFTRELIEIPKNGKISHEFLNGTIQSSHADGPKPLAKNIYESPDHVLFYKLCVSHKYLQNESLSDSLHQVQLFHVVAMACNGR